jgi:hypothetical protein
MYILEKIQKFARFFILFKVIMFFQVINNHQKVILGSVTEPEQVERQLFAGAGTEIFEPAPAPGMQIHKKTLNFHTKIRSKVEKLKFPSYLPKSILRSRSR